MTLDEMKEYLGDDWTRTIDLIQSSLASDIELLNMTNRILLSHGGKQLRPLVSLLVSRACSGGHITQDSIRFAAASELLHNATLLHDDVADCSDERHGNPTVASVLGGPASVLLGDFWLVKAMEKILSATNHSDDVIRLFSKTLSDLAEGELLQLQKADKGDTTEQDYYRIIYNKTASLFEAACVSAAVSVGATSGQKMAIKQYSDSLGLAFQIKDDIFDYSDNASIGKPVGIDLKERKITLPLLGALSRADAHKALEMRQKVCEVTIHPERVEEIRQFVKDMDGVGYANEKLRDFTDKAIFSLRGISDNEDKKCLVALAEFVADRKS